MSWFWMTGTRRGERRRGQPRFKTSSFFLDLWSGFPNQVLRSDNYLTALAFFLSRERKNAPENIISSYHSRPCFSLLLRGAIWSPGAGKSQPAGRKSAVARPDQIPADEGQSCLYGGGRRTGRDDAGRDLSPGRIVSECRGLRWNCGNRGGIPGEEGSGC